MAAERPRANRPDHATPQGGVSPAANPGGRTPHGIPHGTLEEEPRGQPTSERHRNETAPLATERDRDRGRPGRGRREGG